MGSLEFGVWSYKNSSPMPNAQCPIPNAPTSLICATLSTENRIMLIFMKI
ncbi:MAG: hypothetical protein V7K31_29535 [Nostoc sp.]